MTKDRGVSPHISSPTLPCPLAYPPGGTPQPQPLPTPGENGGPHPLSDLEKAKSILAHIEFLPGHCSTTFQVVSGFGMDCYRLHHPPLGRPLGRVLGGHENLSPLVLSKISGLDIHSI